MRHLIKRDDRGLRGEREVRGLGAIMIIYAD